LVFFIDEWGRLSDEARASVCLICAYERVYNSMDLVMRSGFNVCVAENNMFTCWC